MSDFNEFDDSGKAVFDAAVNRATNTKLLDSSFLTGKNLAENLQSSKAAKAALDVTGFVPLNDRNTGAMTKLVFYHLFNITGIPGAIGASIANRALMGSRDPKFMGMKWLGRALKDWGQTHLNAVHGRTGNIKDQGWFECYVTTTGAKMFSYIGPAALLFSPITVLDRAFGHRQQLNRKRAAFESAFKEKFGRSPLPVDLSTENLLAMSTGRDLRARRKARQEYNKLKTANGGCSPPALTVLQGDSNELKAHLFKQAGKELSTENVYLWDWAERTTAHIPGGHVRSGKLTQQGASYQLSKHAIMSGYAKLVHKDSLYTANLDSPTRKRWEEAMKRPDADLAGFVKRWNDSCELGVDIDNRLAGSNLSRTERNRLRAKRKKFLDKMEALEREQFSPEISKEFGKLIEASAAVCADLLTETLKRLGEDLNSKDSDAAAVK